MNSFLGGLPVGVYLVEVWVFPFFHLFPNPILAPEAGEFLLQFVVEFGQVLYVFYGIFQGFGIKRSFFPIGYGVAFAQRVAQLALYDAPERGRVVVSDEPGSNLYIEYAIGECLIEVVEQAVVVVAGMRDFEHGIAGYDVEESLEIADAECVDEVYIALMDDLKQAQNRQIGALADKFGIESDVVNFGQAGHQLVKIVLIVDVVNVIFHV